MALSDDTIKALKAAHTELGNESTHTSLYEELGRALKAEEHLTRRANGVRQLNQIALQLESGVLATFDVPAVLRKMADEWEPF